MTHQDERPHELYSLVGHRKERLVYGLIHRLCEGNYLFRQHKWMVVNKDLPTPKIYAVEGWMPVKKVDVEFWKSFMIIPNKSLGTTFETDMEKEGHHICQTVHPTTFCF